jgi:hypothetical protein
MKKVKLILKDIIKSYVLILLAFLFSSSDYVGIDELGEGTWKDFIEAIISLFIILAVIRFIKNFFKGDKQ